VPDRTAREVADVHHIGDAQEILKHIILHRVRDRCAGLCSSIVLFSTSRPDYRYVLDLLLPMVRPLEVGVDM
jgi:hypothetical protein